MATTAGDKRNPPARRRAGSLRGFLDRASWAPPSAAEIAVAAVVLLLVGAVFFGPHVSGWGFFSDDWADSAGRYYPPGGPGFGNVMSLFSEVFGYRPLLVVFTPLKYYVFGSDMPAQFAWTVLLGVLIAVLLYGILRTLGVPWMHAGTIAALTLVYPWFDSTRLWESANPGPLSISLALGGFWVALVGLSRRSWRWHACAAALYLLSVLAYELTLPLILAAGIVYTVRAGWRTARARWAVDVCVVLAGGLWVGTHTTRTVSGFSADFHHLWEIVEGGATILARTFLPVGQDAHTGAVLALAAVIMLVGVGVYVRGPGRRSDSRGWGLREWLLLGLGGLCVAVLGWAIFIPADPYYTPTVFGMTNRVNGLAGYGVVIFVYAAIGVAFSVVAEAAPRLKRAVPAAAVIAGLALGAAYVHVLDRHVGLWEKAYAAQLQAIGTMKKAFPRMPAGATVFAGGYPAFQTLGVPIFVANWDMNGMIKLKYDDGSLSAYPMLEGMSVACRPEGVGLLGPGAPTAVAPYGKAILLNLATGEHAVPGDRRECRAVAGKYVPGPTYLEFDY